MHDTERIIVSGSLSDDFSDAPVRGRRSRQPYHHPVYLVTRIYTGSNICDTSVRRVD